MSDNESRLSLKAHAKINLTLEVLGKRPDGYHEVAMIMQSVSLHDTVTLSLRDSGISLACDRPDLPCDSGNLAFRAADLLRREVGVARGVQPPVKGVEFGLDGCRRMPDVDAQFRPERVERAGDPGAVQPAKRRSVREDERGHGGPHSDRGAASGRLFVRIMLPPYAEMPPRMRRGASGRFRRRGAEDVRFLAEGE